MYWRTNTLGTYADAKNHPNRAAAIAHAAQRRRETGARQFIQVCWNETQKQYPDYSKLYEARAAMEEVNDA